MLCRAEKAAAAAASTAAPTVGVHGGDGAGPVARHGIVRLGGVHGGVGLGRRHRLVGMHRLVSGQTGIDGYAGSSTHGRTRVFAITAAGGGVDITTNGGTRIARFGFWLVGGGAGRFKCLQHNERIKLSTNQIESNRIK